MYVCVDGANTDSLFIFFSGHIVPRKQNDEYSTYSEVFEHKNDRFCYVINEVTTDSYASSYSSDLSDTSHSLESDTVSSDHEDQGTVILS